MRIVLDASVAVAAQRREDPAFAASGRWLRRILSEQDELLVPTLFQVEVTSALSRAGTSKATIGPAQNAYTVLAPQDYAPPPHYATGPDGTVIVFGGLKGPYDTTRFYAATVGAWLLDPTITRVGGSDYLLLYSRFGDYDGGAFEAPPPFPGRALPMGGESAFFVSTVNATSPSGLTVFAAHRAFVTAEALYPGKLAVFDDPTGDMAPGTVGVAKAAELALVLRKAQNGLKILALDSRCSPK